MKKQKKSGGFTLVELVVVMVIIGILATISVPMYRKYITRARGQEGYALLGSVNSAMKLYWTEWGTFTGDSDDLDIEYAGNRYFTTVTIMATDANTFRVRTAGSGDADGIHITLTGGSGTPSVFEDNL